MGKRVEFMNKEMMPAVLSGNHEVLLDVKSRAVDIAILYKYLVTYLAKISQLKLNDRQTKNLSNIVSAVNDLDHIGVLLEINMVELGMRRIEKGVKISPQSQGVINTVHVVVSDALKAAIAAVVEEDIQLAEKVISMKEDISILVEQATQHQTDRLVTQDSENFEAYRIEVEIIARLRRIYYHCKRIAKTVASVTDT
jgi:phosphate:Na+ symporter